MRSAIGLTLTWFIIALFTLWALAALYIDIRSPGLRIPLTLIYALGIAAVLGKCKRRAALCFAGFCMVLAWWVGLKPSNVGAWQPDTDRTAWAEFNGDRVTIHNWRDKSHNNLAALSSMAGRTADAKQAVKNAEHSGYHVNPGLKTDIQKLP